MLEIPIFNKLSDKSFDLALLILVITMYIVLCAETDMYVPAFPQMIRYFEVEENKIHLILSINLLGLSVTSLIIGPMSDCYGRRKILLAGLLLFLVSSIGCVFSDNFNIMLIWRFIQGIAASVPMVVGAAVIFDKYSTQKAGQLIGLINSIISASMSSAPIIGAWISKVFGWRANFMIILTLAIISFIGTLLFLKETLSSEKRKKLNLFSIGKDYFKLLKSLPFITYTIIANYSFVVIMVYIANLSIIFINYMNIDLIKFSYYQATTMGTFIIFSLLSIKLIDNKGLEYTKNFGGILAILGAIGMFFISLFDRTNVNIICTCMAFIAAGGAMMAGTFGSKAMNILPDMNGTSMAMMTTIRQLLSSILIFFSELFFDGTILPIGYIIFVYAITSVIFYLIVRNNYIDKSQLKEKVYNLH